MVNRKLYETTADYKQSIELLKEFVNEVLDGDIEKLNTFCFDDLEKMDCYRKYAGDSNDPDMYHIVQAIYILLWGDIFNLTFDNMGSWDVDYTFPYRGDTMNSFGSVFGKENPEKGQEFGYRARYFGADKHPLLWAKIEHFFKVYHYLGNFIVLPNRSILTGGINCARGQFYNKDYCEGMRDYFDWFLMNLYDLHEKYKARIFDFSGFQMQLFKNPEYEPSFLSMAQWRERFFLEAYINSNGESMQVFHTPLKDRLKRTAPPEDRKNTPEYFTDEEYLALMEDFLDKSLCCVLNRTSCMVEKLKEILANA